MGDSLILYFLILVNIKQLRLQLNYPHVKLTAQLCAAPYTLLVPSGEQAPPFLWVLSGKATTWCPRRAVLATTSTPAPAPTSPSLPASPAPPCSPPAGEWNPWNIGGRWCEFWSDKWSCVSLGMTGDRVTAGVLLRELVQLLLIEWHSDRVSYQGPALGKKKIQTLKLRVKVTSCQRKVIETGLLCFTSHSCMIVALQLQKCIALKDDSLSGKDQFNVLDLLNLLCLTIANMQVSLVELSRNLTWLQCVQNVRTQCNDRKGKFCLNILINWI